MTEATNSQAHPKVFISYAWSQNMEKIAIKLADRLINDGVEAIIDKYDLKPGDDKYKFMERSATDPEVIKVLILCDKKYADKANNRQGGVGDETTIITPEVYGKPRQEKFIALAFEFDETSGEAYLPQYLKSRIYLDMSSDEEYEKSYEKLLRELYNVPSRSKPKVGSKPLWLEEKATVDLLPLRTLIKQIQNCGRNNEQKQHILLASASDELLNVVKNYSLSKEGSDREKFSKAIDNYKICKYEYLNLCKEITSNASDPSDYFATLFERLYNTLLTPIYNNYADILNQDFYRFIMWEMFISTIAFLYHFECFEIINKLLTRTYFLEDKRYKSIRPYSYCIFNFNPEHYNIATKESISKAVAILSNSEQCQESTKRSMAEADLLLFQLGRILTVTQKREYFWFPLTYNCPELVKSMWQKLYSKSYCKKIMPLFGVKTIEDLKALISYPIVLPPIYNTYYRYQVPDIFNCIKPEYVGTCN